VASAPALAAPTPAGDDGARSPLTLVAMGSIRFYQILLSKPYKAAINPGGCPFEPSCSAYGLAAIREHGLLRGLLMTSDRLQRCHAAAAFGDYPHEEFARGWRLVDPPRWLPPPAPAQDVVTP
jgi:putative membrane protein insertion efficiency factor